MKEKRSQPQFSLSEFLSFLDKIKNFKKEKKSNKFEREKTRQVWD